MKDTYIERASLFGIIIVLLIQTLLWIDTAHEIEQDIKKTSQATSSISNMLEVQGREIRDLQSHIKSDMAEQLIYMKIIIRQSTIKRELARKIAEAISVIAQRVNLDPDLIIAIIEHESNFRPDIVSRARAKGLMQVFPSWLKTACEGADLNDIKDNISCGVKVYSFYLEAYQDRAIALTVYNRGPNPVDHAIADGKDPTNKYAKDVLKTLEELKALDYTTPKED